MKTETRATCILSMQRMTEATLKLLRETPLDKWPFVGGPMGEDMIVAYASDENQGEPPIPDDIWACMHWARQQGLQPGGDFGFDYIIFDRDKDPEEDACDLPLPEEPALPVFVPRDVKEGTFVILNNPGFGADNNCEDREIPAGQLWQVTSVNNSEGPQGRMIDLTHETGVTVTIDDADPEEIRFNFAPAPGPVFSVNVRAMRHLTATLYVAAPTEDAAEVIAARRARKGELIWEESGAEDVQVEGFE